MKKRIALFYFTKYESSRNIFSYYKTTTCAVVSLYKGQLIIGLIDPPLSEDFNTSLFHLQVDVDYEWSLKSQKRLKDFFLQILGHFLYSFTSYPSFAFLKN